MRRVFAVTEEFACMPESSTLLVTGATGKVGQAILKRMFEDEKFSHVRVRALCHGCKLPEHERLEVAHGDIAGRDVVRRAARPAVREFSKSREPNRGRAASRARADHRARGVSWIFVAATGIISIFPPH